MELSEEVPMAERQVGSSFGGQLDVASVLEATGRGVDNVLGGGGAGGGEGVDTVRQVAAPLEQQDTLLVGLVRVAARGVVPERTIAAGCANPMPLGCWSAQTVTSSPERVWCQSKDVGPPGAK